MAPIIDRLLIILLISVAWLPRCPAAPVEYDDAALSGIFGDVCGYPISVDLEDDQFMASSWLPDNKPHMARFNKGLPGWRAELNNTDQWIEVRLPSVVSVTAILTQGNRDSDYYVTEYKVEHSLNKQSWSCLLDMHSQPKIFQGNTDHSTPKIIQFRPAVEANYIRIIPIKWYNAISMRLEIFAGGCSECWEK